MVEARSSPASKAVAIDASAKTRRADKLRILNPDCSIHAPKRNAVGPYERRPGLVVTVNGLR